MDLITLSAAKARFRVSSSTLTDLHKRGVLNKVRDEKRGQVLIDAKELKRYLEKRAQPRGVYFAQKMGWQ